MRGGDGAPTLIRTPEEFGLLISRYETTEPFPSIDFAQRSLICYINGPVAGDAFQTIRQVQLVGDDRIMIERDVRGDIVASEGTAFPAHCLTVPRVSEAVRFVGGGTRRVDG